MRKAQGDFFGNRSRLDSLAFILVGLLFTLLILVICKGMSQQNVADRVQAAIAILTGVSVLTALAQAIRASNQIAQLQKKDILFSLYEMYMRREMHRAIGDVWETMKQNVAGISDIADFLENPDRYQFLKKHLDELIPEQRRKIDESRRMVTHFWYLIENLLANGMLRDKEVFEWFGNPDVIWILESLEVIKQYVDMTGASKTRWPPLLVLSRYYRLKGMDIKILDGERIPLARIDKATVAQIRKL